MFSLLLEGALDEVTYPVGTKRQRKDGEYLKAGPGRWVKTTGRVGKAAHDVERKIGSGVLGGKVSEHLVKAREMQDAHRKSYGEFVGALQKAAPKSKVFGRVKTDHSILGKLVRKPEYKDPTGLQDTTGTTILVDNIDEVNAAVSKVRETLDVLEEDDYNANPKPGLKYRAHHMIVKHNGLAKEVQIKTKSQKQFSEWAHDVYKPMTPKQEQAVEENGKSIEAYGAAMSDHFDMKARGKHSVAPDCPPVVKSSFGCL